MKTGEEKNWLLIKKKDEFAITKKYDIEKIDPIKPVSQKLKESFEKSKEDKTPKKTSVRNNTKARSRSTKATIKVSAVKTGKVKKKTLKKQ